VSEGVGGKVDGNMEFLGSSRLLKYSTACASVAAAAARTSEDPRW
jgi:hypothetical protein